MSQIHQKLADIRRRRAAGERGFSLVELAVVIVVIGILVAIAIPVFSGIQKGAKQTAADAAAANGATMVAAEYAVGTPFSAIRTDPAFLRLADTITINDTATGLSDFCVTAVVAGVIGTNGPSCTGGGSTTEPEPEPDTTPPTGEIVISDPLTGATDGIVVRPNRTATVTITFSEPVKNFENDDLYVVNAGAGYSASVNGLRTIDNGVTWEATLSVGRSLYSENNNITLDLAEITDLAGNPGEEIVESNSFDVDLAPA